METEVVVLSAYKVTGHGLALCSKGRVHPLRVPWRAQASFMGNVPDRADYSPFFILAAQPRKPFRTLPFCPLSPVVLFVKLTDISHSATGVLAFTNVKTNVECSFFFKSPLNKWSIFIYRNNKTYGPSWAILHVGSILVDTPRSMLEVWTLFTFTHSAFLLTRAMEDCWAMRHSRLVFGLFVFNEQWLHT